jgi:oligopeptide transport system substrate-binding protein
MGQTAKLVTVKAQLLLLVALLLIGCGSGSSGGSGGFSSRKNAGSESTFRYALANNPTTLDPAKVQDVDTMDLLGNIYEPLVRYGEDNKVEGVLAESWTVSPDGMTYTFKLRDAKFHDGSAVSASDVKASLERALNKNMASPTAETYLGDIRGAKELLAGTSASLSGVKVVNAKTIEIMIDKPRPYFLGKLSYACGCVVPAKQGAAEIRDVKAAVGTGPFALETFSPEQQVTLKAFADYHGGKPQIATIERRIIKDASTRLSLFKSGETDMTTLEKQDWAAAKGDAQLKDQLKFINRPAVFYLLLSAKAQPAFKDVHLRRAMMMAIDRDRITQQILAGVPTANRWLPEGINSVAPESQALAFDPAKAKAELALSEFKSGDKVPPIEITFRAENSDAKAAIEAIAGDLRRNLGLTIQPRSLEWGAILKARNRGELPCAFLSWYGDYIDPQNFLSMLLTTDASANFDKWSNRSFDALCANADVEPDASKRAQLYAQAENIVLTEVPRIPLYHQIDGVLVNPRVSGLRYNLLGSLPHDKVVLK